MHSIRKRVTACQAYSQRRIKYAHIIRRRVSCPYNGGMSAYNHRNVSSTTHLGDAIKKRRVALGLTQQALADRSGVTRATIAKLETGEHDARVGTLGPLASVLGTTIEALRGVASHAPANIDDDPRVRRPAVVMRVEQRISAAEGTPLAEERAVPVVRDHLREIDVRGDCMSPTINDGDTIWIDLHKQPKVGDIVVFWWQSDWTLKRLRAVNGVWVMVADNPAYPLITIDPTEVRVMGVVVKILKSP